jgi:hypothetical protein
MLALDRCVWLTAAVRSLPGSWCAALYVLRTLHYVYRRAKASYMPATLVRGDPPLLSGDDIMHKKAAIANKTQKIIRDSL